MSVSRKTVHVKVGDNRYKVLQNPSISSVEMFPKIEQAMSRFYAAFGRSVKFKKGFTGTDSNTSVFVNFHEIGNTVGELGEIAGLFETHERHEILEFTSFKNKPVVDQIKELFTGRPIEYFKLIMSVLDVNYRSVLLQESRYIMKFPDTSPEAQQASKMMVDSGVDYLYQRIATQRNTSIFEMETQWSIEGLMTTHKALDVEADISAYISKKLDSKKH